MTSYTDKDLDEAVKQGIFSEQSVAAFRARLAEAKDAPVVEESFRLITSFNDIFVVFACLLLLGSSYLLFDDSPKFAGILVVIISWGLAEFFVRKRKMAFPAVVLLLCFVGGVFVFYTSLYGRPIGIYDEHTKRILSSAFVLCVVAAGIHWWRFKVPLTVAVGVGSAFAALFVVYPLALESMAFLAMSGGLSAFIYAMYWDVSDRDRTTHRSDIAFWLHLLSAVLIVYSASVYLDLLDGIKGLSLIPVVYFLLMFVSLVIDRRVFMIIPLGLVIEALAKLFEEYDMEKGVLLIGLSFGAILCLLSIFWHNLRAIIVSKLPFIPAYLPEIRRPLR